VRAVLNGVLEWLAAGRDRGGSAWIDRGRCRPGGQRQGHRIRTYGPEGERRPDDVEVFIHSFTPRPDVHLSGAIDSSAPSTELEIERAPLTDVDRPVDCARLRGTEPKPRPIRARRRWSPLRSPSLPGR
jgi:hypothetical protein